MGTGCADLGQASRSFMIDLQLQPDAERWQSG